MAQIISILLPDFRGGGAERVMLDLGHEFQRLKYRVEFVVTRATGDLLPEAKRHFHIIDLSVPRFRRVFLPLARYIYQAKPDAIIANMWPLTSAAVLARAMSRHKCKLLLVEHITLSKQYGSWGVLQSLKISLSMSATYRYADLVAGVSEGVAVDTAKFARLPASRLGVLYNPIPQRATPPVETCNMVDTKWGCPRGLRILTVGNLKDQKNHALLLRSFSKLQRPDTRLMILGKGENEGLLRSLSDELGIADRVIFAGFQSNTYPFYVTADLFVLSSDYEGFGNVIVEALSFGLPVVSTDCPSGPAEILGNGRWGKLVPVCDADALTLAMDEALSISVDREGLKKRAADFSPEIVAAKYLKLLDVT